MKGNLKFPPIVSTVKAFLQDGPAMAGERRRGQFPDAAAGLQCAAKTADGRDGTGRRPASSSDLLLRLCSWLCYYSRSLN